MLEGTESTGLRISRSHLLPISLVSGMMTTESQSIRQFTLVNLFNLND